MDIEIRKLNKKVDERGWLIEIIGNSQLKGKIGLVYLTVARPGVVKGNHYHNRKTEWFCVIKGKGILVLVDEKNNEKKEINVSEDDLSIIKIPPGIIHAIKNTGKEDLYLLAHISEEYNVNDPDTFFKEVLK
ncbi:MAG: cupin domain-containing protein [Candidatus Nanoarchaeia archaeon]|nr:cupin domain-containing protein [Candidatus Nanoarchaeia archaeon]